MTKDDTVSDNPDKLKQELEELNSRIRHTLEGGNVSTEKLQVLIKETEEIQKKLIAKAKTDQENTVQKKFGKE